MKLRKNSGIEFYWIQPHSFGYSLQFQNIDPSLPCLVAGDKGLRF